RQAAAPARPRPRGGNGGLGGPGARGPPVRPEALGPRPQHHPRRGRRRHPQRGAAAGQGPPAMIVIKFGGTSGGYADRIGNVWERVRDSFHRKPVVVVSDVTGIT